MKETFAMKLRESVAQLRAETGVSLERIADELGVTTATLHNWKNGKGVGLETVDLVADYFGWDVQITERERAISHSG